MSAGQEISKSAAEVHAQKQVADSLAGTPPLQYKSITEVAKAAGEISAQCQDMYSRIKAHAEAALSYVRLQAVPVEYLGGILKHTRIQHDALKECVKMLETGQNPPSLRAVVELIMATNMMVKGPPFVLHAFGKKFVATGEIVPTLPNPKKEPENHEKFCEWLRSIGKGDMIKPGVELPWSEIQELASARLQDKNSTEPPLPDFVKQQVVPKIKMSDDKRDK